ncbi:sensor domain-containing diguanylate cyclase [Pelagibius sp. CAU 1746]|uniref:sensor domain-containing diguanylate cyclase n=1 Tax=Pelagibius sp. CAU 1746 TaxID=3140370 RepID=UPI00325B3323
MTAKSGSMAQSPAVGDPPDARDAAADYRRLVDETQPGGLLSAGGAFAHFPGAVLIAGHNGIVLGANDQAEAIAQILHAGRHEELRAAIQAALGGISAQVNPLVVSAGQPKAGEVPERAPVERAPVERAYDVVVLPWADGTAALLLGRDVTLERSLRAALVESRQRYKDLVEISNDFAWETDAQGRFVFVSPRGALGYEAAELVGRPAGELLLDAESGGSGAETSPFTAHTVVEESEVWVRSRDGAHLCLLSTALPLTSEAGDWIGARGVCRDVTSLRCHEADLAEARNRERLFSYIVNMVRRELEPARMLSATAEALMPALALTGISIHALVDGADGQRKLGSALAQAGRPAAPDDLRALVARLTADQQAVELEDAGGGLLLRATRYRDEINGLLCARRSGVGAGPASGAGWSVEDRGLFDNIAGQVGLAIEQLARQTEMEVLSMTDPLTGLHNRRGFVESLEQHLGEDAKSLRPGALFYIDLDNFKQVNDTHGHQTGDEALLDVAALLKEHIRGGDLAARLGGDEFALFLGGMERQGAERKAELMLKAAERLRGYSGDDHHLLGFSLGVAIYDPRTGEGLDSLLRRADEAMYGAKRAGKHSLNFAPDYDRRAKGQG